MCYNISPQENLNKTNGRSDIAASLVINKFCHFLAGDEVCYEFGSELIPYEQAAISVLYDVGACNVNPGVVNQFNDDNISRNVTDNFCCAKDGSSLRAYKCNR